MAADQQKKRLNAASVVSCKLQEQYRAEKKNWESPLPILNMRSHISLEWDDYQKKAVAKREQIGMTWRDVAPFIVHVSHCHMSLADVFAIPLEIFELENVDGVLSYEVWETHLSETEENLLTQFLPKGKDTQQVVQALLTGENFHFGNPFLKWGASLCSGNLHPDAVLCQEQFFRANKIAYYSELQKYHNDTVDNLQKWKERWASCKDSEKEIVQNMWRSPRKHAENCLSSHANESGHCDQEENLAATAESCLWVEDEKVCSSNKQKTSMIRSGELQERKGFMDRCGNSLVASERPNMVASSRTEENLHKRYVRSGDGAKYMSYVKISRKQHQLVKRIKQSGDGIQTKSLNLVLGHIKSFQVQPYEAFEEEERKKLHEQWLQLANRSLPAAFADCRERQLQRQQLTKSLEQEMAEKKKYLMEKDEEQENSDSVLQEQKDDGETDREPTLNIQSYEDDEEYVPQSTRSRPLQRIPSLNGHHSLDPMDTILEEDNQVILKPEGATPYLSEFLGNINTTEDAVERGVPVPSTKVVWPAASMPDSYYRHTSISHGYTSASELSLRQPQPFEEQPTCLVDLESDILEDVGEELLHRSSNDVGSALHIDKGGSFFSSYPNQDCNELLQPLFKGQGMLPSCPYEHKQPGLQFLATNNGSLETGQLPGHLQEQQQQLLEQRHTREKELYMHRIIRNNMYSNGGRYSIPREKLFSLVDMPDCAVDPVHISAPLQSPLNGGGLLGQNWYPGEHRARGVWSGMDGTGAPGQCLGSGSNTDESLFSVLLQCHRLQSCSSSNSMSATEQYVPTRNFEGGGFPRNNDGFPQTAHQLNCLSGSEAAGAATLRANNMSWMNLAHQSSSLHDSIRKPFLRSWND